MYIRVQTLNDCGSSSFSDSLMVDVFPGPVQFNMVPDGGYCEGGQGFEIYLTGLRQLLIMNYSVMTQPQDYP